MKVFPHPWPRPPKQEVATVVTNFLYGFPVIVYAYANMYIISLLYANGHISCSRWYFFTFFQCWGLDPGLCACQASTALLPPWPVLFDLEKIPNHYMDSSQAFSRLYCILLYRYTLSISYRKFLEPEVFWIFFFIWNICICTVRHLGGQV
jgi:hypothetical protein